MPCSKRPMKGPPPPGLGSRVPVINVETGPPDGKRGIPARKKGPKGTRSRCLEVLKEIKPLKATVDIEMLEGVSQNDDFVPLVGFTRLFFYGRPAFTLGQSRSVIPIGLRTQFEDSWSVRFNGECLERRRCQRMRLSPTLQDQIELRAADPSETASLLSVNGVANPFATRLPSSYSGRSSTLLPALIERAGKTTTTVVVVAVTRAHDPSSDGALYISSSMPLERYPSKGSKMPVRFPTKQDIFNAGVVERAPLFW
ncbi:hypothetical protein FA13DRAFT_1770414 [Coprinellus micaceus]|uniref:Uncharacterized protein n=1 Tax=Coprinellus micaceus TaxID=71717 RepID=A0A4Y7TUU9_COPMI|nr:hypothetical protein FA13DRAFT_1770414 [Coprinellus micaceus]